MDKNKEFTISGSVSGRFSGQFKNRNEEILKAFNSSQKFICGGGRRAGKTHLRNLLIQQEATRKQQTINTFLQMNFAEIEIRAIIASMKNGKLIVKIEHHPGFYSADCPMCGKTKILSSELNTLSAVCDKCYYSFLLEK